MTTGNIPLNGVNVPALFATLDVVRARPAAAEFQFRASNEWLSGSHSRSTISSFYGAGEERRHSAIHVFEADHPEILVGHDNAPTPTEALLHAIAACITAGIGIIAAARGVKLYRIETSVEGDIDLTGLLGLDGSVRNGYRAIDVAVEIEGDASAEELNGLVGHSVARSAVYDVVTNGVPVNVRVAS